MNLSSETLALVQQAGYSEPTPVQAQAIPVALEGKDVIASAQTGTGKTASFVLPMVEKLVGKQGTYGLILAPTREIAQQIQASFELFGGPHGIRSIVLIGGIDMRLDEQAIQTYPHVIVATPGRLCDHLDRGNIWLDFIQMVILDEADRMLDMGFSDQLSRIMQDVPTVRQTMLFSATFTPSVEKLARKILRDPVRIAIGKPQSTATTVEQSVRWMSESEKNRELRKLIAQEPGSMIVFTRSKQGATNVWRSLHSNSVYDATYIHSDRLQSHREQALADFKEGKFRILIATDVAARGIHVDDVAHVVNFDLPMEPEDYVHRIGRTGRAGATGKATTFVTPRDRSILKQIEKLIGFRLGSPSQKAESKAESGSAPETPAEPVSVEGEESPVSVQASRSEERTGKKRRKRRRTRDQERREEREGQQDWEEDSEQKAAGTSSVEPAQEVESPRVASSATEVGEEPRESRAKGKNERRDSRRGSRREERRYAFPVDDIPPGVKNNGPVTALSVISLDSIHLDEDGGEEDSDVSSSERSKPDRTSEKDRSQKRRRRKRRRRSKDSESFSSENETSGHPPR